LPRTDREEEESATRRRRRYESGDCREGILGKYESQMNWLRQDDL
jgi:hypothetical protein